MKKELNNKDPRVQKIMSDYVDNLIKVDAGSKESIDRYWAQFKAIQKALLVAEESLKEAKDCSYGIENTTIREAIANTERSFKEIHLKIQEEREAINKKRFAPLKLVEPTEFNLEVKKETAEVKPLVYDENK